MLITKAKNLPAAEGGEPVRSKFLIFGSPQIGDAEIQEVVSTLRSGWLGTGPRVERFEKAFGDYCHAEHAVALNSCTAGLHLALLILGIGEGDEVITSPMTFAATANVIMHTGARPVFVDIDPETMNVDPDELENAITSHTKAILPVHFAGRPCAMDELLDIASRHGLRVIEDAAHAIEAWYHGRKIGSLGDITAFSFYATKNLTTGEGGMVTTSNSDYAEQFRVLRLHGLSRHAWKRYSHKEFAHYEVIAPGFKYNMMDIQAAIGIHQLARIEKSLERREEIWREYDAAFKELPVTLPLPSEPETRHARHIYTICLVPEAVRVGRNRIQQALFEENIGTGIHFVSIHLHDFYRKAFGFSPSDLPAAAQLSERTISVPLSPSLSDQDVADVIEAVRKVLIYYRR